jgi:hypothetical protein
MKNSTNKFEDLDKIVDQASELEIDIYNYIIYMFIAVGHARPIAIYLALLEDMKTYSDEKYPKTAREISCITCLAKLVESGLLNCELENGFYSNYTIFYPACEEKYDYFIHIMDAIIQKRGAERFKDIAIKATLFSNRDLLQETS